MNNRLQFIVSLVDRITNPLMRIQARLHALGLEQMRLFNQNFHSYGNSAAAASRKVAMITAALTAAIAATAALTSALLPLAGMTGAGIGAAIGTANTAGVARESAQLQQTTGIDAATLQQYRQAGRAVGVEAGFGTVGDSGKILTELHGKLTAPDDALAKTLQQVRIPLAKIKELKADEVLQKVVAQTQKLGMTDVQASVVLEELAGDASKLLPLLRDNAATLTRFREQSSKVGAIITPEQAELMKITNTEWALMKTGVEGYGNILSTVGGNFMKLFGSEINQWFADNADGMRQWAGDSVQELQRLHGVFKKGGLQAVYEDLFPNLSAFTQRVGAFVTGFTASFGTPFMETVRSTWARVSTVLGNTAGSAQGFGTAFGAAILPVMTGTMEAIGDAVIFLEKNWNFVKQLFAWSPLGLIMSNWGAITNALEPVGNAVALLAEYFGLVAPGVTESGSAMGSLVGVLAAVAGVVLLNKIAFGAAYHIVLLYRGVLILLKATTMAVTAVTWAYNTALLVIRGAMIAIRAVSLVGFMMSMGASMAAASVGTWSLAGAMAVLTSPITLIIAAVALLAAGAYYLYTHWAQVTAYLSDTSWGQILLAVIGAITQPFNAFNTAVNYLSGLWASTKASLAETTWGQALLTVISVVLQPFNAFNAAVNYLSGLWASTKASLAETTWGQMIFAAINALFSPFEMFKIAVNATKTVWDGIKGSLADTSWGQAIISTIQSILGWITKFTEGWASMKAAASEKISGAWGSVKAAVGFGDSAPTNGGARALGGPVLPGRFYRVAERGPELMQTLGGTFLLTGGMSANIIPFPNQQTANSPSLSVNKTDVKRINLSAQNRGTGSNNRAQNSKVIHIGAVHIHTNNKLDPHELQAQLEMIG